MRLGIKGKQVFGVTTIVGAVVVGLSLMYLARLAQVSLDESRARAELLAERPGLSADEATRLLVARLLHGPALALKELARGTGTEALDGAALVRMIARLFGSGRDGGRKDPKEGA